MRTAASLVLPRERHTVPVARALVERTLRSARVVPTVISDLSVAVSEACTNAVCYATGDEYRVDVVVDLGRCTIVIEDRGAGFDQPTEVTMPPPAAAKGRGLGLMCALVDDVEVRRARGGGAIVTLHRDVADVTAARVSV